MSAAAAPALVRLPTAMPPSARRRPIVPRVGMPFSPWLHLRAYLRDDAIRAACKLAGVSLRSRAPLVLRELMEHARDKSVCWPHEDRLAQLVGVTVWQLSRIIGILHAAGLIRRTHCGRAGNKYEMLWTEAYGATIAAAAATTLPTPKIRTIRAAEGDHHALGKTGVRCRTKAQAIAPEKRKLKPSPLLTENRTSENTESERQSRYCGSYTGQAALAVSAREQLTPTPRKQPSVAGINAPTPEGQWIKEQLRELQKRWHFSFMAGDEEEFACIAREEQASPLAAMRIIDHDLRRKDDSIRSAAFWLRNESSTFRVELQRLICTVPSLRYRPGISHTADLEEHRAEDPDENTNDRDAELYDEIFGPILAEQRAAAASTSECGRAEASNASADSGLSLHQAESADEAEARFCRIAAEEEEARRRRADKDKAQAAAAEWLLAELQARGFTTYTRNDCGTVITPWTFVEQLPAADAARLALEVFDREHPRTVADFLSLCFTAAAEREKHGSIPLDSARPENDCPVAGELITAAERKATRHAEQLAAELQALGLSVTPAECEEAMWVTHESPRRAATAVLTAFKRNRHRIDSVDQLVAYCYSS